MGLLFVPHSPREAAARSLASGPARGRDRLSQARLPLRVGAAGAHAQACARQRAARSPSLRAEMVTPLVKHKIVKKRLKPFLRNQSDGKLAMGVRDPLELRSGGCAVAAPPTAACVHKQRLCCLERPRGLRRTFWRRAVPLHAALASLDRCGRARSWHMRF